MEEILSFNNFFPIVDICLSCEDTWYSQIKLCDGAQMAIFGVFFASCIFSEHISDMHSKFALSPVEVW